MEANITQDLIEKYYEGLNEIFIVLKHTDKVAMSDLIKKKGLSQETRDVLKNGNVIKITGLGRASRWKWITIPPTKQMALKTIKEIQLATKKLNKIQRKRVENKIEEVKQVLPKKEEEPKRGGSRPNSGRKSKVVEFDHFKKEMLKNTKQTIEFSLFWGLIKYKKQ
tara:strand:- start:240 stop:737 length:498 start_codon:yes stop_codon:yes gene_type:complete